MILDANRRIRFVNLPGAIFAGRSRAALAGQDAVGTILPPSDRDGGYIRLRFEEGREVEFVVDCAPLPVGAGCPSGGPATRHRAPPGNVVPAGSVSAPRKMESSSRTPTPGRGCSGSSRRTSRNS
ncbi:hypothetical protein [Methanoculleus chikugoensis]|uniref:hypothetical protein n=1 Tax=Methanoculleus chikugoensis TaxID=118126 RepID=UPI0006CF7E50|nr:hypothetical protein [Methanoculleus chikugoensis]